MATPSKLPFPSNENSANSRPPFAKPKDGPWVRLKPNEQAVTMFDLHFSDGRILSFAYSDVRELRMLHPGHLVICLYGMEKTHILVEGRHLLELHKELRLHRISSITEDAARSFHRDEKKPAIDRITVELLTGPSL